MYPHTNHTLNSSTLLTFCLDCAIRIIFCREIVTVGNVVQYSIPRIALIFTGQKHQQDIKPPIAHIETSLHGSFTRLLHGIVDARGFASGSCHACRARCRSHAGRSMKRCDQLRRISCVFINGWFACRVVNGIQQRNQMIRRRLGGARSGRRGRLVPLLEGGPLQRSRPMVARECSGDCFRELQWIHGGMSVDP
eukprot:CCRYP_008928-RC/>CCRYP_008928-RC protein AED:0.49 eAED:1.00 QI:0/0/0/1/0/0/3/0/193